MSKKDINWINAAKALCIIFVFLDIVVATMVETYMAQILFFCLFLCFRLPPVLEAIVITEDG